MTHESSNATRGALFSGGIVALILLGTVIKLRLDRIEEAAGGPVESSLAKAYEAPKLTAVPETKEGEKAKSIAWRQIYVPISDHVYHDGGQALSLDVTLKIRNLRHEDSIIIKKVELIGSQGKKIRSFAKAPFTLESFSSTEFLAEAAFIEGKNSEEREKLKKAGTASHFIVEWGSRAAGTAPLIEAVMIDTRGHLMQTVKGFNLPKRRLSVHKPKRPPEPRYPQPALPDGPKPKSSTSSQPEYELIRPKNNGTARPKSY